MPRPPWLSSSFSPQIERLDSGEPAAIERALAFLEDDPWGPGSGYAKEHVARKLARHRFDHQQQARLTTILLYVVDVGDRWEFRWYCRLARKVPMVPLHEELAQRLTSSDPDVRRRALWMLAALQSPRLSERQLADARAALLDLAAERPPSSWSLSLRNLAVRFWSLEWETKLLALARTEADEAIGALRLLGRLPRLHHECDAITADRIAAVRALDR